VLAVSSRQFAKAVYDKTVYNVLDALLDPRLLAPLGLLGSDDNHHCD